MRENEPMGSWGKAMNSTSGRNPTGAGAAFAFKRTLDVDAFAASYGGVTVSRFKAGAVLYAQGDPADAMFYLQDGQVQITVVSSQGKEGILSLVDPGSLCGEGCLLGNRVRVATAACIADSVAARLERASIIRAVREDPAIAELFVVFALKQVVELRENLISQLFDSSERRLARALVLLANHSRGGGMTDGRINNVIRNIDQEALAQLIGTTRSRVNHFMNKFRKLGYIDYEGSVIHVRSSLSQTARFEEQSGASGDGMALAC